MVDRLKLERFSIWRITGFVIRQERDRESDDMSKVSNLFTFGNLNPQVEFSTRLSRKDRLKLAWYFFKSALIAQQEAGNE